MSMNISLTPYLEKLVKEKVKSGRYLSSSEVIREGLRLLEERDKLRAERFEALKRDVRAGVDQIDRGEAAPFDPDHYHQIIEGERRTKKTR
jgi:antitoxin ParD1/3/4